MGNTGLRLNIITPLQKFSKGGTTTSDVIRQRYVGLIGLYLFELIIQLFILKKEMRVNT